MPNDLFQHPEFLRRSLEGRELVFCNRCFGLFWVDKATLRDLRKDFRWAHRIHAPEQNCRGDPVFAVDAEDAVLEAILTRLSRKQYTVVEDT